MNKSIVLTLAALIFFSACSARETGSRLDLRFGFTSEPVTLDILNPGNTADGRSILFNVFEGLVKPDSEGNLLPCLAESWIIEQNGLIYNFTLREGVYFHDGSSLNSSDVKFSLETAAQMGFTGLEALQKIETNGDNFIKVFLKSPDPDFLPYLTIGIVKNGNNDRERNLSGTGPFLIESYTTQQNLVLSKFENYWNRFPAEDEDIPHLEKVIIVFFENSDAQMTALIGGSIDGARITGSMASQLDHRNFNIINSYSAAVQLLALNNAAVPLDDIRVRQALTYGIDIQNIIDSAFFGRGIPSISPLIPGLRSYYISSADYQYNPDVARSLLESAGFTERNKLSLEITVPSNFVMHIDTAQVIASQLAMIGVDASIKLVDWNTWLSDVYFGRNYQATIISLDSPVVCPRSFLSRYHSDSSVNFINFSSSDFDSIYDSILTETDETMRIFLYREAQKAVTANAASVFIQDIFYFYAFRSGTFSGVLNYPLYVTDFSTICRIN